MLKVRGQIVDIPNRRIYKGEISVEKAKIISIDEVEHSEAHYIIPGFVDAHIHIESSMLTPSQFSTIAVKHGTVATVSDPHEIANVLGVEGVEYMIQDASTVPLKFNFGAPSCVPATSFETSGACVDCDDIESLLKRKEIRYLSEMMNYPGVIHGDKEVHKKLEIAKGLKKPIDGHAPGLVGEPLDKYLEGGISTDHECYSYDEALEKLQKGIKILIREGSAAKNFDALIDLMPEHYKDMMFCSDDKHPDDLMLHHINDLCKRAVEKGVDVFKVLQAACINPVEHYGLEVGQLRVGDAADFVILEDLKAFKPNKTYIDGELVFDKGKLNFKTIEPEHINNFECEKTTASDFRLPLKNRSIKVIEAFDGELITGSFKANICIEDGNACSNLEDDILKMVVVNRYPGGSSPKQIEGIAFVKNFGLKQGAIASSVAHDSHNIIAVGTSDNEISNAVNLIIENKGGICTVNKEFKKILKLPIAGLMSDKSPAEVAKKYSELDSLAKEFGSILKAPFMTLSFMALLVIPSLKLSDKGLFDGDKFQFVSLEE